MRVHAILVVASLIGSVAVEQGLAAIPKPHAASKAQPRMVADAKAAELAPARIVAAPPAAPEVDLQELLQRAIRERDNIWSARLDDIDARLYEVVGRMQLLGACLIGLLLGMFVWLASVARQVAQLAGEERADRSGGFG